MSACEACWTRAYVIARRTGQSQAEVYRQLIQHPCESELQASILRHTPTDQVESGATTKTGAAGNGPLNQTGSSPHA